MDRFKQVKYLIKLFNQKFLFQTKWTLFEFMGNSENLPEFNVKSWI